MGAGTVTTATIIKIAAAVIGGAGAAAGGIATAHSANMQEKNAKSLAQAQAEAAKRNVAITASGDAPQADTSSSDEASELAAANKAKRRYGLGKTANPGVLAGLSGGRISNGTTIGKKNLGG